jgi:hypothetical protein
MYDDDDDDEIVFRYLRSRARSRLRLLDYLINQEQEVRYREPPIYRRRWDDAYLLNLANRESSFIAEYRLDPRAFFSLCDLLEPQMITNQGMASRAMSTSGSKPISLQSRVASALIILGGGRVLEAMRTHGLAKTTVISNFRTVVRAINSCDALRISCDNSLESLRARADGFQSRSANDLFKYCTGAIDGIAITIRAPKGIIDQRRFYSGNKKKYCINMQGVCDSECRFIAMTCKHVGSTNDVVAFTYSSLKDLCDSQSFPYHWNGDAAYSNSKRLMAPYEGSGLDDLKESFNFLHSQVRITIERAFGILVQRFGILWSPIKYELGFIAEIIHACCRLHNYCITHRLPVLTDAYTPPAHTALDGEGSLGPNWGVHPSERSSMLRGSTDEINSGNALREEILQEITRKQYIVRRSHHRTT